MDIHSDGSNLKLENKGRNDSGFARGKIWGETKTIICLLVFSFVLRMGTVFFVGPVMEWDSFAYDNLAQNMLSGFGYIDTRSFRILDASYIVTPVYPLFLYVIYSLFGHNLFYVILFQQLLGGVNTIVIYFIGSRIFDQKIGFWSGFGVSLHPWLIFVGNTIMTEALFTFLFSLSILFLVKGLSQQSWRYVSLSGLLFGISILCRPVFQGYFLIASFLLVFFVRRNIRTAARYTFFYAFPVVLILSIWGIHNYKTKGYMGIVPTTGMNLLAGMNLSQTSYDERDYFERTIRNVCEGSPQEISSVVPLDDQSYLFSKAGTILCTDQAVRVLLHEGYSLVEINKIFLRIGVKHIVRNPPRYFMRAVYHGLTLWSGYQTEWLGGDFDKRLYENVKHKDFVILLVKLFFRCVLGLIILIFTITGIYYVFKNDYRMGYIPISIFVYITLLCSFLNLGYIRYRIPVEPFILMIGLVGVMNLKKSFKNWKRIGQI